MEEQELRQAGEGEPTVNRIDVGEFASHEDAEAWLKDKAPVFLRGDG